MTQDLIDNYEYRCNSNSDINEHLPTLKHYAEDCEHITEMGVRWVVSTFGFMMGLPKKLISYDIDPLENWGINTNDLVDIAYKNGIEFQFKLANTLDLEIEETDLLFLDTDHTYQQVKGELTLHGNKSKKYIIFHDTTTFEFKGMNGDTIGLWPAIEEFINDNPHWSIAERFYNNNGLTILKRI
jgi:hypothetical protein